MSLDTVNAARTFHLVVIQPALRSTGRMLGLVPSHVSASLVFRYVAWITGTQQVLAQDHCDALHVFEPTPVSLACL